MTSLLAIGVGIEGRLSPVDLRVEAGQMVALVGPNGGGKTSLLRALARVERSSGSVAIGGEDVDAAGEARRRRLLSFLPASRDMAWPIAARDVIALGLGLRDEARIDELVGLLELKLFEHRPINRLSTGERARMLIARALAARPAVLLLDEPLANLEPYWVLRMMEILRGAANEGAAVLVALHDLAQMAAFDRALLIAGGRVEMNETPTDLVASERFESIFRVRRRDGNWQIRP